MAEVIPIQRRCSVRLFPGQLFIERYRLRKRLGRGGMGEVWLSADEKIERFVAIKILHPRLLEEPGYHARFVREAQALAKVEHPCVVPLYDWGTEPQPFIVMKRVEGTTLRDLLREHEHGRLHWVMATCLVAEATRGLAAMHRSKLWHRDIKPENVMVDEEGQVTIVDLGIAREAAPAGVTDRIGTRGYLPPEMLRRRPTDHRGDLYQIGVVLYELLTGQRPFRDADTADTDATVHEAPESILSQIPTCPEALEHIVMRLLAKEPADRCQTAAEVAIALAQVLKDNGSLPPGEEPDALQLRALVLRALVRRKLDQLAAPGDEDEDEDDGEATEEDTVEDPLPTFTAESQPAPVEQHTTVPGEPVEQDVPRGPRTCGYYPAAVVPVPPVAPVRTVELPRAAVPPAREPFPIARPRARPAAAAPTTVELPRAAVPPVREPFPIARPRSRSEEPKQVPQAVWLVGAVVLAAVLAAVAAVVTVRALDVRAVPAPPSASAPPPVAPEAAATTPAATSATVESKAPAAPRDAKRELPDWGVK